MMLHALRPKCSVGQRVTNVKQWNTFENHLER
jgi:hypothetical protein